MGPYNFFTLTYDMEQYNFLTLERGIFKKEESRALDILLELQITACNYTF
jgi:hypothetical protein